MMCDSTSTRKAAISALSVSIALVVSSSIFRRSFASFAVEPATRPAAVHRLSEASE